MLNAKGNTPQIKITNANQRAQDASGRRLPTYEEVGDTKPDKYVGISIHYGLRL